MSANTLNKPGKEASGKGNAAQSATLARIQELVAMLRAKLRDYPELNLLVEGVENSDRVLAMALVSTLDDFNSTPPLLDNETLFTVPINILMLGATAEVMMQLAQLMIRNQLSYSDGQGIQASASDKGPQLFAWRQTITSEYEQKKSRYKMAKNLNDALSRPCGVSSEWEIVHGFYDALGTEE